MNDSIFNRPGSPRLALRAAVFALLAATGYALWYFATDETRPALSLLHWAMGLVLVAALPVHIAFGRCSRATKARPR